MPQHSKFYHIQATLMYFFPSRTAVVPSPNTRRAGAAQSNYIAPFCSASSGKAIIIFFENSAPSRDDPESLNRDPEIPGDHQDHSKR
jgi:hypothetical protein